jgi:transcriptional regulator with XRE-family HTH domain
LAKSIYTRQYDVFKNLLRLAREEQGLTQKQLGRRLRIHQSRVSNIELGERRMDVVELRAWCEALGMTLESFMAELIDRWQKQKALSHKAKSLTQSSGY